MNNQVQTLKGFRDFLGNEARKRQWLIQKIRAVFEKYGYEPLETPALEYESLLLGKYGAEADKLIFGFEDRGERRVALRYDQTVPTARIVAQYQNQLVFPFKRYQIQPVWRSEKPQKGRYREFFQCDADIIGNTSYIADADLLAVCYAIYKELGLTSLKIKINDRSLLINTIENAGIEKEKVFTVIQTIDKLDKKSQEEVLQELIEKDIAKEVAESLLKNLETVTMPQNLQEIVSAAVTLGIPEDIFLFSPTLARGLDYYTGLIFEGVIPEYPAGSVVGGGRYDNLLEQLVGVKMPALGFAVGFDRTLEAVEVLGKLPTFEGPCQVLVTVFSPELLKNSLEATQSLREKGISAECYMDPNKKLGDQIKYANRKNIPYVIVIGPEEVEKNVVKVKDMTTGEQKEEKLPQISF
jgi:histidyl-tRNA synthetase